MPTIADLPIGAKLKFGAYSVADEAPHKICWIKVHNDGTLLSEFMEDQLAFDAKEPGNPDSHRRVFGNNRYSQSNIHQFLNAESFDWFQNKNQFDEAPVDDGIMNNRFGYVNKPGFLHYFDSWEIEAIEASEVKTAIPNVDTQAGGGAYETMYSKVFLPSIANVGTGNTEEGEKWEYFYEENPACPFSPELFELTPNPDKPDYDDEDWYYYLRSANIGSAYYVRCVNSGGGNSTAYAADDYLGIRPALKLSLDAVVSDDPDVDGYYEVLNAPQEIIEIDEEEFFAILKTK